MKRNQILNNSISLYTPISDDEKCELQEVIEDPNSDVFNILINSYDENLLFDSLYEELTPIEFKIFKLRMHNYKQHDISKILGISQAQVSRLLRKVKIKYTKWKEIKSF